MSDKNQKAVLLAREQASMEKAVATFNLKKRILGYIPEDAPVPDSIYDFGYCAHATLTYENSPDLSVMLAAFPPLPCTYVRGNSVTVKPTLWLQPQDSGRRLVVYPVIFQTSRSESEAAWWTRIEDMDVRVVVKDSNVADVQKSMGDRAYRFVPDSYSYSTGSTAFWALRRKTVEDLPEVLSPYGVWSKSWDDWADNMGWNAKEKQYLNRAKAQVTSRQAIDVPGLREMLAKGSLTDVFSYTSEEGRWLTATELETMLDFVEDRQAVWPQVETDTKAELQRAREWFEHFYATHGEPGSEGQGDLVAYLLRKETGLAGRVYLTSRMRPEPTIEVGFTLDQGFGRIREDATHIRVQCKINTDLPAIDWDALAEYF